MMIKNFVLSIVCITTVVNSFAQDEIINGLGKSIGSRLADKGAVMRASLDSVDFQFSISINDGAGFFDIEQRGEFKSKFLYSIKEESEKNMLEKSRDSLEVGLGMYGIRRYEIAETTLQSTRILMEKYRLTNEIVYLRVISNLGLIYLTQGKTSKAESYISQSLKNSEKSLGKLSAAYISNLNNYAKLHQLLGKYNEAEKEFEEALTYSQEVFGGGMQQAILLNNKAMLYQTLGQFERSVDLMNMAINASTMAPKKTFEGSKGFDNRKFQANLGKVYQVSGDLLKAEAKFLELKKIYENRKQTKNAEYASILNQLGILYVQMNKFDQAEELLINSASVYKRIWGENTIYFARTINDLGNLYRIKENYKNAEKWLNKAYVIRKQLLNKTHPDYTKTQEDLAILYWKTGRIDKAYTLYTDVMNKTIDVINRYFPPMSEAEKTKYWDITSPRFQRFYNFALENHTSIDGILSDMYNYNMLTKGLLLNATSKVRQYILKSNDKELIEDYLDWKDQKEQLARIYTYSKNKLKKQNINLTDLEDEANTMEKSLSERSVQFSTAFAVQTQNISSLNKVITPSMAVVDIIRLKRFDQDFVDDVKYLALILKKGEAPEVVVIDNGLELENKYIKFYRNSIKRKIEDNISFEQFWGKIEEQIVDKEKIYFSPDGVFNELNINTLLKPDGQYMIVSHDLTNIGNSKDLFAISDGGSDNPGNDAFLLGSPDYSGSSVSMLPGTLVEINAITKILESGGYSISSFKHKTATEGNIKSMSSPRIVHIASHGYFQQNVDNTSGSVFGVHAENASNNPLLRSGLLLSGLSATEAGSDNVDITSNDNGILTAYEAMNLNLEETTLVVLSACETGLGDVKSGEGVYGLQRAFQVAGAEALIMSLWKVDDAATQELMTLFYNNWVKLGDKHLAFRQAQLKLKEKFKEPIYWGAFVMIGG